LLLSLVWNARAGERGDDVLAAQQRRGPGFELAEFVDDRLSLSGVAQMLIP
jgi:hypothetical protein